VHEETFYALDANSGGFVPRTGGRHQRAVACAEFLCAVYISDCHARRLRLEILMTEFLVEKFFRKESTVFRDCSKPSLPDA
ncbi:unnamed protein product, partial [Symbiodinium sp. CCMP2456]